MSNLSKRGKLYTAGFRNLSDKQYQWTTKTSHYKSARAIATTWERIAQRALNRNGLEQLIFSETEALENTLPVEQSAKAIHQYQKKCQELLDRYHPTKQIISFLTVSKQWLETKQYNVAPSSYASYLTAIADFISFLDGDEHLPLDQFKRSRLREFQSYLKQKYGISNKTVNGKLKQVKGVLTFAYEEDVIDVNLGDKVKSLSTKNIKKVRRAFTKDELALIKQNCDDQWWKICTIAIYTGQRLGDIVTAKFEDFDTTKKIWSLVAQKTTKSMSVPLLDQVLDVLEFQRESNQTESLFPTLAEIYLSKKERREGSSGSNISNMFRDQVLQPAGLIEHKHSSTKIKGNGRRGARRSSNLCFHSFRHTTASLLAENNVPIQTAMQILGHSSQEVHLGYMSLSNDNNLRAMKSIGNIF